MRTKNWLMVLVVVAMAVSAGAQTKLSATCNQSKPDPNYSVPVGDKPDHVIVLGKVTCTFTTGDLGGAAIKAEEDVYTSDASGKMSRDHGYGTGTVEGGDKYFLRFDGTTTMEKNAPVSGTCTWNFAGGTGKLKGLTGKGTCKGKFDASGAAVFDIEGEYQVAAAKAK
jgi:hypothetical protein